MPWLAVCRCRGLDDIAAAPSGLRIDRRQASCSAKMSRSTVRVLTSYLLTNCRADRGRDATARN